MPTKELCLDALEEYDQGVAVPLTVEVLVPNEYGGHNVRIKRFRTVREVYRDMDKALDAIKCFNCGEEVLKPKHDWWHQEPKCCGKPDWSHLIDEYSSCCHFTDEEKDAEIGDCNQEHIESIMCYCNVGGNEGYNAQMTVSLRNRFSGDDLRLVQLYRVKSFRGMDHVHDLCKRMLSALGEWRG